MYMCAGCEYLVPTEARRGSHPLEEELQIVVGLRVGAGPVLCRTAIALYSWATSPAPMFILLSVF